MTDLIQHAFHGQAVRVITDEYGEPWFVLADLCAALGIRNARDVAARLDEDMKGVGQIDTLGGRQSMTTVTEAGMYDVIVRSDSPSAKPFRRWVTTDVLPTIRRTGSYSVAPAPDLTTPAGVLAMAEQFVETARALVVANEQIAALEPRAEVADLLLDATGDLSVADAAKALARSGISLGSTRLFAVLADLGWLYRGSDQRWHVRQTAIERGRMAALPQSHYHPRTGERVLDAPQPRVTPKGIEYLLRHLRGGGLAVVS
ncbi:BRO family protein [Cellulomonas composti]|uniref:Antirepressor n=1 Tax=Cellulomonas composti TaxID=266130 RepID=A0A511JBP6_9CELL|nr:phage antirepressor KilAC domain-containing protein [Cellulomonas composti]GEL95398.1 antirepressor [Cellulomonas composti]